MKFDYNELLKDPRWITLSEKMKDEANWTCTECGTTDKPLHVHHTKYITGRKPWQYHPSLLKVLCKDCHKKIHAKELFEKRFNAHLEENSCYYCEKKDTKLYDLYALSDKAVNEDIFMNCCKECCFDYYLTDTFKTPIRMKEFPDANKNFWWVLSQVWFAKFYEHFTEYFTYDDLIEDILKMKIKFK